MSKSLAEIEQYFMDSLRTDRHLRDLFDIQVQSILEVEDVTRSQAAEVVRNSIAQVMSEWVQAAQDEELASRDFEDYEARVLASEKAAGRSVPDVEDTDA